MRAISVFALLMTCLLGLGVMSMGLMTWDTFAERYNHHLEERELAREYIQQPHCRKNSMKRSKLKGFQHCDRSERILAGSPFWFALLDVSHTIPPLLAQLAAVMSQHTLKWVLTISGLGLIWSWVRKYTGGLGQWSGNDTRSPKQHQNRSEVQFYEEDVITPMYSKGLPMWHTRRRRRLSDI